MSIKKLNTLNSNDFRKILRLGNLWSGELMLGDKAYWLYDNEIKSYGLCDMEIKSEGSTERPTLQDNLLGRKGNIYCSRPTVQLSIRTVPSMEFKGVVWHIMSTSHGKWQREQA